VSDLLKAPAKEQNGELTRELRDTLEIGLEELARRAQISVPMLSQFERGNRKLSPAAWSRVHAALNAIIEERSRTFNFEEYAEHKLRMKYALEKFFPEIAARHPSNGLLEYALYGEEVETGDFGLTEKIRQRAKAILNDPSQDEETRALVAEHVARILGRNARWIESLEKAQSQVHDPVLSEIIASFRNEIAELEQRNAQLERRLTEEQD
jgi:transcriptional regulator with XRE-family HTH domain